MIRAVYFDLDDTLCAYWSASRSALSQAFEEHALDVPAALRSWREVFKTFSKEIKTEEWYARYLESGEPTRTEHLRRTLAHLGMPDEELASSLSRRYAELRSQFLGLFEDAIPMLEHLRGRYRLGIITNGPTDVQRDELAQLRIERYFDQVLIEGEVKAGKPAREIFAVAERFCNLSADEMLFVGNAFEHDVQGAKASGWHAVWLNRGKELPVETGPRPDAVIRNLYELCGYLHIAMPDGDLPQVSESRVTNWR